MTVSLHANSSRRRQENPHDGAIVGSDQQYVLWWATTTVYGLRFPLDATFALSDC